MNSTKLRGAPGFASRRKENDTRAEDSIPRVGRDATAWQRLKPAGTARILPLLLLLILPVLAQAQFNYEISNGTLTITGYTGAGGDVVIPGTIDGLPVTSIGDWAFVSCAGLTSITIPDSVTSIGQYAFAFCASLSSVTTGNGVTSIGDWAFTGCTSFTSVTIGNSVTSIHHGAFFGCSGLNAITIDALNPFYSSLDGVLFNKSQTVLIQCPMGKSSVTIPDSVTSIGDWAFVSCAGLADITIPDSVTSIGINAFCYCTSLPAGPRMSAVRLVQ